MTTQHDRPVDDATYLRVLRFYAAEARLLDEERYSEWLELMAPDLRYWMPGIENRYRRDPITARTTGRMSFFDDSLGDLRLRVRRLESGCAWPEDPPTRHVYAIGNVEAFETDDDELLVLSVFTSYRNKLDRDESLLMGRREDRLRRNGDRLSIAKRAIFLSQSLLLAKNLNVFF